MPKKKTTKPAKAKTAARSPRKAKTNADEVKATAPAASATAPAVNETPPTKPQGRSKKRDPRTAPNYETSEAARLRQIEEGRNKKPQASA